MRMIDTGDLDSKVVLSPPGEQHALDADLQRRLSNFFNTYKRHEGKVTEVTGWGSAEEARTFLDTTAGFFSSAAQKR
jgi:inorganic pyrophosphatase